jgi:uncharacterized protein
VGAAFDYLSERPDVDAERLALVGHLLRRLLRAARSRRRPARPSRGDRGSHLRDSAADLAWLGSEATIAERLARGQAALEKYETTGEVEYVPAVDFSRTDVGMPGLLPWSWYQLWADRGLWENRYAVMSDAAVLSYDSISAAARLTTPLLMVHSDQCAVPDAVRRQFAVVPTADKRLVWEGENRHFNYYEDPTTIERAVWSMVDWFARHLRAGQSAVTAEPEWAAQREAATNTAWRSALIPTSGANSARTHARVTVSPPPSTQ